MNRILKQIAFYGGLLITFLGLVLILIVNETKHSPEWLITLMMSILFTSGIAILIVIINKGVND